MPYLPGIPILSMSYTIEMKKPTVWKAYVHAPFKKVIAFDLLFLGLGMIIGAGIITAILGH